MSFDLDQFRLPEKTHPATTTRIKSAGKSAPRKQKTLFIKGPIPIPWLGKAGALKREVSLHLGLILWHQAGLENTKENL
jgi:hypothetical protein